MRKLLALFLPLSLVGLAHAEIEMTVQGGRTGMTSNSVIDIDHDSTSIWLGTGGGASATSDSGATWTTYGHEPLAADEVSALSANDRAVWVATSHSREFQGDEYPEGDGISFLGRPDSVWINRQPMQATRVGMLAYDLSLHDSLAFGACFYGGLIRSTDWGVTWTNLFPTQLDSVNTDSADFDGSVFRSLGNRFFSVKTDTTDFPDIFSVWGGAARGIYRFFFYADTITGAFHTYPDSIEQYAFSVSDTTLPDSLKLPGNHVVALGINLIDTVKTVWAACRAVVSGEERRVAYTTDDGATWHIANIIGPSDNPDVEAWDFAFNGDTVYVATSFGLYQSNGDYSSWTLLSGLRDPQRQTFYQDNAPFYAVDVVGDIVWAGGSDGAARRSDGEWRVYRSQLDPANHYAYPSPFSPYHSTRKGSTVHFRPDRNTRASVKIYDFNLELVKTVAVDRDRIGGVESDDIVWDGTNDKGKIVANGIYFYRVELDYGEDLWGKVVVIK
ncbi:MAG: hypothetical protein A2W25_12785 [candidate division Zixibacteria bacterium RBG_16_53_22]|nr:MAG: hypothetical protein A2W25_12785 [candidate division Zixibacteria bacterium RBG_16_53_22]